MVAGKQHPLLFEQVAQVIGCMPGSVEHGERRVLVDGEALAVGQDAIGLEGRILILGIAGDAAQHLGSGALPQFVGRGRMVLVGVRDQDPADRARRRLQNSLDVRCEAGARIDDRPFVARPAAHQIGVGARAGHHAAVVGADPDHPIGQAHRAARHDGIRGRAMTLRIELADLGPGEVIGGDRVHAFRSVGNARHGQRDRSRRAGMRHHLGGRGEAGQGLERVSGGIEQLEGFAACDRIGRREPELLDQFDLVMGRLLFGGRDRKEEPGIPALGADRRSDPAAEVREAVGGQRQAEVAAELGHGGFAPMQP